jgi:hypothetical protein
MLGLRSRRNHKHDDGNADDVLKRQIDNELAAYRLEENLEFGSDALEWWRRKAAEYPSVARIARKYLAIQASSAPSERVFSCAKRYTKRDQMQVICSSYATCVRIVSFVLIC